MSGIDHLSGDQKELLRRMVKAVVIAGCRPDFVIRASAVTFEGDTGLSAHIPCKSNDLAALFKAGLIEPETAITGYITRAGMDALSNDFRRRVDSLPIGGEGCGGVFPQWSYSESTRDIPFGRVIREASATTIGIIHPPVSKIANSLFPFSPVDRLIKLCDMIDRKLITDDESERIKELLREMDAAKRPSADPAKPADTAPKPHQPSQSVVNNIFHAPVANFQMGDRNNSTVEQNICEVADAASIIKQCRESLDTMDEVGRQHTNDALNDLEDEIKTGAPKPSRVLAHIKSATQFTTAGSSLVGALLKLANTCHLDRVKIEAVFRHLM